MKTAYNLFLTMGERESSIPKQFFDSVVKQFGEEGLLGRKKIDLAGRVFDGFDRRCGINLGGEFNINSHDYEEFKGLTTTEMLDKMEEESEDDETALGLVELMRGCAEYVERHDPLRASLSVEEASNLPYNPTRELRTVWGIQSIIAHTKTGKMISFWKPKDSKRWWDLDQLRKYIHNQRSNHPVPLLREGILGKVTFEYKLRRSNNYNDLLERLAWHVDDVTEKEVKKVLRLW